MKIQMMLKTKVMKMGIWDKIKNMLGITNNDGTIDNNADQAEKTKTTEESKAEQIGESEQNAKPEA